MKKIYLLLLIAGISLWAKGEERNLFFNFSENISVKKKKDTHIEEREATLQIQNATSCVLTGKETEIEFICRLVNPGDLPFKKELIVRLKVNGKTYTKDLGMIIISPESQRKINFPNIKITPPKKGESQYFIWEIEYQGESPDKIIQTSEFALYQIDTEYSRKIVIEEGTGTWCGNCIRGIVGMKAMKEKYPDSLIGIAIHGNDIMEDEAYQANIFNWVLPKFNTGGTWPFPSVFINRMEMDDPLEKKLEEAYQKAIALPTIGSVKILSADFGADSTRVKIKVASSFAFNTEKANFSYSFIVIENDVRGESKAYNQLNAYANGTRGKMGGYENLPSPVPASQMVYQEVARGIAGEFTGIPNSIPQKIVKDQEVTYEYSFKLPESILKKKNIEVIALLLDNATGEIWNADNIAAKNMASKIKNETEEPQTDLYMANGNLILSLKSALSERIHIEFFSVGGEKVKETVLFSGKMRQIIPTGSLKGFYIVKVRNGKDLLTKKIIL